MEKSKEQKDKEFEERVDKDKKLAEEEHDQVEKERVEGNQHEEDQRRVHKPLFKR